MRRWLPSVGDELHKPPPSVALDPDQFLDDIVNRTKRRKAALRDDAMRRTIGFFEHRVGLRVSCYLLPQLGDSLAGSTAEPKKWPERQSIRFEEYPEDAGGRPLKQFDACRYLRPPRSSEARLELHVAGQPSEFQRQIIAAAVDLGPQNLEIPHVLAPQPAQKLAKEYVLYEVFAGAGFRKMRGIRRLGPLRFKCLRHLSAFRTGHDGNSLPVARKSTGSTNNKATELTYPVLG